MTETSQGRIASAQLNDADIHRSLVKKYQVPIGICLGGLLLIGGSFGIGLAGGLLSGVGTKFGLDRIRESNEDMFNWILQNPGKIEAVSMILSLVFASSGLGVMFIMLVSNFSMSYALDFYAMKYGDPNAQTLSLASLIRSLFRSIKSLFTTVTTSVKEGINEIKQPSDSVGSPTGT